MARMAALFLICGLVVIGTCHEDSLAADSVVAEVAPVREGGGMADPWSGVQGDELLHQIHAEMTTVSAQVSTHLHEAFNGNIPAGVERARHHIVDASFPDLYTVCHWSTSRQ